MNFKFSHNPFMSNHLIICGAGAAGLTAAIFAAEAGARVTLLERTDKAGKKILMSGGTRCNVLPVTASLDDYHSSSSKNLLRRVFKSWSLEACKTWFTDDIDLELACEEASNKWFPKSNSAKEVRDKLLQRALSAGVELRYKSGVKSLHRQENRQWTAELEHGGSISGDAIIIATGGLSIPTTGTTGMGHDFLSELGHTTGPVYPALTPLKTSSEAHKALSGISLDVSIEIYRDSRKAAESTRSGFLFTHGGYSGPAVLDVSHHHRAEVWGSDAITYYANWEGIPVKTWKKQLQGSGSIPGIVRRHLPRRLADALCDEAGVSGRSSHDLRAEERKALLKLLTAYPLPVSGDEGYRKAEVTGGGVPLSEIDTATMESKRLPGVYLCGEMMDVFGRIGGFNFYWAWLSGRLAGMRAAERLLKQSKASGALTKSE